MAFPHPYMASISALTPQVEQDTGTSTSDTATFASPTTTGNGVIVLFALKGGRRVATLSDNKSNTYVRVGFVVDQSDAVAEMWYCQPITGGASHTLTVTFDAAANCVWGAVEVSRVKGGSFLDAQTVATFARNGSGSSASVSVTSGVPRGSNELFVAMLALAGGGADAGIDTPTGWTQIIQFNDYDAVMAGHGAHRVNPLGTALTSTWTNDTTTAPAAAIIAAFRAANAQSAGVSAPVNTVLPVISGDPTEGETLTTTTGDWSNSPDAYTFQWLANAVAISGATASSYVLTASEIDANITVAVTAHNEGGTASATSAAVGPVAAAGDEYWSNVKFLARFSELGDVLSTVDDSPTTPHTITFNGHSLVEEYATGLDTDGVLWCDGSTGYASVPDNADFEAAHGTAYTIDFWIRPSAVGVLQTPLAKPSGAAGLRGWSIDVSASNGVNVQLYDGFGYSTLSSADGAISVDTWHHIEVNKTTSSVYRLFIDGVLADSDTFTGVGFEGTANGVQIGRWGTTFGQYFNGRIKNVRMTSICRHPSDTSFTPPSDVLAVRSTPANTVAPSISGEFYVGATLTAVPGVWTGVIDTFTFQWKANGSNISGATSRTYVLTSDELGDTISVEVTGTNTSGSATETSASSGAVISGTDSNWGSVAILLKGEGAQGSTTITDSTGGKTVTAFNGAQVSRSRRQLGGASLRFDGTNDYCTTPDHADFEFASGQAFTIECFVRFNAVGSGQAFLSKWNNTGGGTGWYFQLTSGNEILATMYDNSTFHDSTSTGASIAANTWYHVAWCRNSSNVTRLFINGVMVDKDTRAVSFGAAGDLNIGRRGANNDRYVNGRIDSVRITRAARYDSDTSFTPPVGMPTS